MPKKEKKNLFGLAFEIPDELQQIIEKEMQQAEKGMMWKDAITKKVVSLTKNEQMFTNQSPEFTR